MSNVRATLLWTGESVRYVQQQQRGVHTLSAQTDTLVTSNSTEQLETIGILNTIMLAEASATPKAPVIRQQQEAPVTP